MGDVRTGLSGSIPDSASPSAVARAACRDDGHGGFRLAGRGNSAPGVEKDVAKGRPYFEAAHWRICFGSYSWTVTMQIASPSNSQICFLMTTSRRAFET